MFENVESYDQFLTYMESVDYTDSQVILNQSPLAPQTKLQTSKIQNSKSIQPKNEYSYSSSYPPATASSISQMTKFYSMDISTTTHINALTQVSPSPPHVNDLEDLDLDIDIDFDLELESPVPFSFTGDSQATCNPQMPQPVLQPQSPQPNSQDKPNPVAPGLFPHMDINDETQFLPFKKLPLNPSFIVP